MNKKIYIVTKGEYSDYRICGVFDNKELAEKFAEKLSNKLEKARIEEWELNPAEYELKNDLSIWYVTLDYKGNCVKVEKKEDWEYYYENTLPPSCITKSASGYYYYIYCFARDEKHAIKIASEKLFRFKVEENWKPIQQYKNNEKN